MNRDHMLGWPPALLALDPEPRKSLRTPVPVRLSAKEQQERRDLDIRLTLPLIETAARAEQAKPAVAPDPIPPRQLYVHKGTEHPTLFFKMPGTDLSQLLLVWGLGDQKCWRTSARWFGRDLEAFFEPWTGPAPDAPPAEATKPVEPEWLYFKGAKTGTFYRRRGPREQLFKWVDTGIGGEWRVNTYSGPTGSHTNYNPITPDQLPKEALA